MNGAPPSFAGPLFHAFLAPLVLGGPLVPSRPIGGRRAILLRDKPPSGIVETDTDLASRVSLRRVRVARRLVPVDTLPRAPSGPEWVLAAMLHDLVQATHPGFDAALRRSGPARIFDVISRTIDDVPAARTVHEALSRHTWFARLFDITRTDTEVRWWTGHRTFLGEAPPARLLAWPEVRRVEEIRTRRPLMELPPVAPWFDAQAFVESVTSILTKLPLTDLATLSRTSPAFRWTPPSLAFIETRAGRTLALRAWDTLPAHEVDRALGRATRALEGSSDAARVARTVLRDRALRRAERATAGAAGPGWVSDDDDTAFAATTGTNEALLWLEEPQEGFPDTSRTRLIELLRAERAGTGGERVLSFSADGS